MAVPILAHAASMSVWWPTDNVTVSGTQPFKALVSGMSVENYQMYWQVDGGQLNLMSNDYRDYPHKESMVDLAGWTWRASGEYRVNFIAKDLSGSTLAQNQITIITNPAQAVSMPVVVAQPVTEPAVTVLVPVSTTEPVVTTQTVTPVITAVPIAPIAAPSTPVTVNSTRSSNTRVSRNRVYSSTTTVAPTTTTTTTTTVVPATNPTPVVTTSPVSTATVVGNPLSGMSFFVDPNNPAKRQADSWRLSRSQDAAQMDKIASEPGARWFGNWNGNIRDDVKSYVDAAAARGQVPVMIAYNIPQRDCGSYSAGGSGSPEAYKAWIRSFAEGIGNRTAVIILEPDALTLTDCLSQTDKNVRFGLIKDAMSVFKANGKTKVYLDSGHSNWVGVNDMAVRLNDAGIAGADGFALNVSNFEPTSNLINYGTNLSKLVGGKHFVLDTSRNGLGSNGQWCNPDGRALGAKVTTNTGNPLVDAYLWLKVPGESDGNCNGGPSAGHWWPEYALGLAQRSAY